MIEKLIDIEMEDKGTILGILHLPDKKDPLQTFPCVAMFYGFNGSREEAHRISVKFARRLTKQGIACFRFDYIGCSVSSGEFYSTSIENRKEQGLKVMNYLSKHSDLDPKRLGVVGFSDGTRVALSVCKESQRRIPSILWSPVLVDEEQEEGKYRTPPELKRNKATNKLNYSYLGLFVHPSYFNPLGDLYIEQLRSVLEIGDVHCIFGGADERNKSTKQAVYDLRQQNQSIGIYEIPEALHLFESKEWINQLFEQSILYLKQAFCLDPV